MNAIYINYVPVFSDSNMEPWKGSTVLLWGRNISCKKTNIGANKLTYLSLLIYFTGKLHCKYVASTIEE